MRGERDWRDLFELADRLPLGSCYVSALADDDEIADEIAAHATTEVSSSVPLRHFSPEMYQLTRGINALLAPLASLAGIDDGQVPFLAGPATALSRARARREDAKMTRMLAKVVPHQFGSGR